MGLSQSRFALGTFRSNVRMKCKYANHHAKTIVFADVGTSSYRYHTAAYSPVSVSANRRTHDAIFVASILEVNITDSCMLYPEIEPSDALKIHRVDGVALIFRGSDFLFGMEWKLEEGVQEGFWVILFVVAPHQVALQHIKFGTIQSIAKLPTEPPKMMLTWFYVSIESPF
ncbi:hypothetical protein TNCV_193141 [Trichonephila clavipes]|nr:hypothetical protein TNCV_193141 [Trichonephila clavipes]